MKSLRIVIPAYNEETAVASVIDRVRTACPEAEVVVVDDGSIDRTYEISRNMNVEVVRHHTNYGYGRALKSGFKHSSGQHIEYFAFLDSDNTYPPEMIPQMLDSCKKEGYDIVVGSRFLGSKSRMPLIRRLGNRIFALVTSVYTGHQVTDVGSGLRVIRASLLRDIENLPDGLNFTPAMTMKVLHLGRKYKEVPIEYSERVGKSKLRLANDGYNFLKIIIGSTRSHRPFAIFATISLPLLAFGVFLGIYAVIRWLEGSLFIPSFILTTLLVSLGMIGLLFGLIADMIVGLRRLIERLLDREREFERAQSETVRNA